MTDTSQPEERAGDYSYDLVHEEVRQTPRQGDRPARPAPAPVTHTPDDATGDYSYDMAHDIPALGS
jgi:hypothetical protein